MVSAKHLIRFCDLGLFVEFVVTISMLSKCLGLHRQFGLQHIYANMSCMVHLPMCSYLGY